MRKRILSITAIATAAVMTFSGCSFFQQESTNAMGSYDFESMKLIQLEKPVEGQDVAVIETDCGTMTAVLYTEYAPKTIENFKNRVKEGFYEGKSFFAIETGIYAITGASNEEGTEGVTDDGNFIKNECSVDLWPFKGALMGYSSKAGYSDSRFFFSGALEITQENINELKGYTHEETSKQVIPDELINAFTTQGSVPGFAASYTVFGQVINGFDTLDEILWTASDINNKKPVKDIKIKKITLDTYSEGKFTLEEPTADKFLTKEEIDKLEQQLNSNTSAATVKLDDYKRQKLDDVKKKLDELSIKTEVYKINDDEVAADCVIKTEPAAGSEIQKNTTIKVYVSLGKKEQ
ncbi:MAG: peptidylprolyl isomerase [Ruminiclostridium sp.]|nr:peptidylprolyl isomerase [Ruminiclostridium sp.]